MLETRAIVVQAEGSHAWVQADQDKGCGQCSGKGCGAGKLSGLFCRKPRQFEVDNPIGANVGDQVVVAVADGAVLRGTALVYGLPLLLLAIGALLGNAWAEPSGGRDIYAAAGAFSGLAAGFVMARWVAMRGGVNRNNRPHIARRWTKE